jgi:hypothetical protein
MSQPPYGPPPNNVTIIKSGHGCLWALLILVIVGTVFGVLFMGGCLAVFA